MARAVVDGFENSVKTVNSDPNAYAKKQIAETLAMARPVGEGFDLPQKSFPAVLSEFPVVNDLEAMVHQMVSIAFKVEGTARYHMAKAISDTIVGGPDGE